MKTLTFIVVLLAASSAQAWEFRDNPDRFPSVGVNVAASSLKGDKREVDGPGGSLERARTGSASLCSHWVGLDVRLPINSVMTLNFYGDSINTEDNFTRDFNVYHETTGLNGYHYGAGIRFYMNH